MINPGKISLIAWIAAVFSIVWITLLAFAEFIVGERHGLSALITYMPQLPLGIPIFISLALSIRAGKRRVILLNIVIMIVFVVVFMGFNFGFGKHADSAQICVMTWNVHGGINNAQNVLSVIEQNSPDAVFLQEVDDFSPLIIGLKANGWNVVKAYDVAVASRHALASPSTFLLLPDSGRRALVTKMSAPGGWLNLVCVHFGSDVSGAPQSRSKTHLCGNIESRSVQVRNLIEKTKKSRTIIAGDFNMPPRGVVYYRLARRFPNTSAAELGLGYTYPSRFPLLRIDHILTTPDLHPMSCKTVTTRASDHLPVVARIALN